MTKLYLYCGEMMALSEPQQVYAKAILVNLTDEHEPASLLSAEQVKRNADGSLTVQASDGGLTLNIARNASVTPFGTKNKAKLEDIRMGTRFFAWYDTILESYPAQASTDKVVLLPSEDDTFAIVIEGDMVAGEGRMTNGVAMVPLRLTAELCGFTVKWNARDRTVHLTNGTVQTTVTIGRDAYFRATALPDADGMSRPGALGAAPLSRRAERGFRLNCSVCSASRLRCAGTRCISAGCRMLSPEKPMRRMRLTSCARTRRSTKGAWKTAWLWCRSVRSAKPSATP
ncbi:MAG: stalk domain-containing protein [Butyricicoccus sp.]